MLGIAYGTNTTASGRFLLRFGTEPPEMRQDAGMSAGLLLVIIGLIVAVALNVGFGVLLALVGVVLLVLGR